MKNLVLINKHHIPVAHVVLFEAFSPNPELPLSSSREFKARIVMLNRDSILTEQTVEELTRLHRFRHLAQDSVAINPAIFFRVESFSPVDGFRPSKPFQSRLVWRDPEGGVQSKLFVATPDELLAVIASDAPRLSGPEGKRPASRRRRTASPNRSPQ